LALGWKGLPGTKAPAYPPSPLVSDKEIKCFITLIPEEIAKILSQLTSPGFSDDEIKRLISKILDKKAVSKEEIEHIQGPML
jgi:hypothetical protein